MVLLLPDIQLMEKKSVPTVVPFSQASGCRTISDEILQAIPQ